MCGRRAGFRQAGRSEDDLERHLDVAWAVEGRGDTPEVSGIHVLIGNVEDGRVERVEKLEPQLGVNPLVDGRTLDDVHVEVVANRPVEDKPLQRTGSSGWWVEKHLSVEGRLSVGLYGAAIEVDDIRVDEEQPPWGTENPYQPLKLSSRQGRVHGVEIAARSGRHTVDGATTRVNTEWRTAPDFEKEPNLEAAHQPPQEAVAGVERLALSERQLIDAVGLENVRDVKGRPRFFKRGLPVVEERLEAGLSCAGGVGQGFAVRVVGLDKEVTRDTSGEAPPELHLQPVVV